MSSEPGFGDFVVTSILPLAGVAGIAGFWLQPRRVSPVRIALVLAVVAGLVTAIATAYFTATAPGPTDPDVAPAPVAFLIGAIPAFLLGLAGAFTGSSLRSRTRSRRGGSDEHHAD